MNKTLKATSMTIAIIAGEVSGDLLGGPLIQALREHFPYARFVGIGGAEMQAQGLESWEDMNVLSVMGLSAVLKRLPQLLELRSRIVKEIVRIQPSVFIGIDAPDFNLGVAKRLKAARIKTVHYVSPSVWAWRQSRVFSIAQSVDLMLTLFPFEREFYLRHGVNAVFVGHPAADEIPLVPSQNMYRDLVRDRIFKQTKSLTSRTLFDSTTNASLWLAVLPGSRAGEIQYLGPVFFRTMLWLHAQQPQLGFIIACNNGERRQQLQNIQNSILGADQLPVVFLEGGSRTIIGASDAVLLSSGTATLETLLFKKPMVVAYKWHWLTHLIISRMVKIKQYALPNIVAGRTLVPEFIQNDVHPDNLGPAVLDALKEQGKIGLLAEFTAIHQSLALGASNTAAAAIAALILSEGT